MVSATPSGTLASPSARRVARRNRISCWTDDDRSRPSGRRCQRVVPRSDGRPSVGRRRLSGEKRSSGSLPPLLLARELCPNALRPQTRCDPFGRASSGPWEAGPAPGAFALLEAGWKQVTAADRSPDALNLAKTLASHGQMRLETSFGKPTDRCLPAARGS